MTVRHTALLSALALGALSLPGTVSAATEPGSPWRDPEQLSVGAAAVGAFDVVGERQAAVAVWAQGRGPVRVMSARQREDGTWTAPVRIAEATAGVREIRLTANDEQRRGGVAVVWTSTDAEGRSSVRTAVRPAGADTWTAPRTLVRGGGRSFSPDVAMDAAQRVTVVWHRKVDGVRRVQSRRLTSEGWSRVRSLSSRTGHARRPRVAVHAGRVLAVWEQRRDERHRIVTRSYYVGSWRPPTVLAGDGREPQAAAEWEGMELVTWVQPDADTRTVLLAERFGTDWRTPATVTSSTSDRLVHDLDGASAAYAVAWSTHDDGGPVVRVAERRYEEDPAAVVSADLAATDGTVGRPAVSITWRATGVAWTRSEDGASSAVAAVHPLGEAWGEPTELGPSDGTDPAVATTETGRVVVLWRSSGPDAGLWWSSSPG